LHRLDAERETRQRNHDPSGPALTVRLGVSEAAALLDAIETHLTLRVADPVGSNSRSILEDLHTLFISWSEEDR
jgi:hypothetical protein